MFDENLRKHQAKRRVTLREVASKADVSPKTASNVINGTGRMSVETRKRVEDVIQKLGYNVNISARNLNRGMTGSIQLALPHLTAPYLANIADKVIEAARDKNYVVNILIYPRGGTANDSSFLNFFNDTSNDGIILSLPESRVFSKRDLDVAFPLVCIGSRTTWGVADRITTDEIGDASRATGYLLDHGAKTIAVIGARRPFSREEAALAVEGNAELRLRGILEECQRRGVDLHQSQVGVTNYDWSIGNGYKQTEKLLGSSIKFDGLICLNDQLGIGAVSALAKNHISIPDEVQIISFDNIEESAFLHPPLTTVDSSSDWIARTAVERLLEQINGNVTRPETFRTSSQIIERETTR